MMTMIATMVMTFLLAGAAPDDAHREAIQKWREQRETRLKSDTGWLTLAGLFWLKDGDNKFGSDPSNEVALPEGAAPASAGTLNFHDGRTVVTLAPGVEATVDGKPVTTMELKPDSTGSADVLVLGRLSLQVIKRGEKYGIRVKDT